MFSWRREGGDGLEVADDDGFEWRRGRTDEEYMDVLKG